MREKIGGIERLREGTYSVFCHDDESLMAALIELLIEVLIEVLIELLIELLIEMLIGVLAEQNATRMAIWRRTRHSVG